MILAPTNQGLSFLVWGGGGSNYKTKTLSKIALKMIYVPKKQSLSFVVLGASNYKTKTLSKIALKMILTPKNQGLSFEVLGGQTTKLRPSPKSYFVGLSFWVLGMQTPNKAAIFVHMTIWLCAKQNLSQASRFICSNPQIDTTLNKEVTGECIKCTVL